MDITFCGGAREVGASCYLVKIDDKNILLDCGIRMKGNDNLPDFRLIQEMGGVDAIIVSHAHLDHSGSLPVISREYPEARIYMTHASKSLVRVLFYDSLKIMERDEADIPIYAEKHIVEMLDRVICFSPQYDFKPIPGEDIKVTFYNGGHIAGAALIYIQGNEGTLMYTGDFSATDQQTVIGCSVPQLRPDVMISEATYGDKLHSNRKVEEERLVETVRKVIERGGKMLIPAFALGRAQEIILILRRAMNKNQLPVFDIYIDGMVRAINRIYRINPNYLKSKLARKIFCGNDIFYDNNVLEVKDHDMREEVAELDEPYCIISSSGMLKGGPSCFYAEEIIDDENNFIAITGYQDEEAPGRDLIDLLEDDSEKRELEINNKRLEVKCETGKYGLSAHADKGELTGLFHRVSPRKLFLVHGDEEVIEELAEEINKDIHSEIYVPTNGGTYLVEFNNPRKQLEHSNKLEPLNKEKLDEENIEQLWEYIFQNTGTKTGYSIEELIFIQEGNIELTEENITYYRELLNDSIYFTPNRRRLFLYHPVSKEELIEEEGPMEMNKMLATVDELFPAESGLYKKGARIEENIVLLNFNFPDVARNKYRENIQELEETTGWKAEINEDCNLTALEEEIYRIIPPEIGINKFSYYRTKGECEVVVDQKPKKVDQIKEQYQKITGIKLLFDYPEKETLARKEKEIDLDEVDPENMMEQNQAFAYIDDVFESLGVKIYKKSRKVAGGIPYMELYFISPQVGKRYRDTIENLREDTGWNIKMGDTPVQNEIIKLARRLTVAAGLRLKKNPGLYRDKELVKVEVRGELEKGSINKMKDEFKQKTGYDIEFIE